jgi:Restriction endonuclease XhoI
MRDLDAGVRDAVRHFWLTRQQQSRKQATGDEADRGARSAVTGGKQMDGFIRLVRNLLVDAKIPADCVSIDKRVELPGWFRAEKKWDLIVVHESELVAALEFKSQIGPSFGNNFNNRTEEALGSATDIWAAYREGAFKPSARPLLGYFMLLEDCGRSRAPVKVIEPHFSVFPEFKKASYCDRYAILVEKLLRDRVYDAACLLLSTAESASTGDYLEPHPELTFAKFVTPLVAHVAAVCSRPK